VSISAPGFAKRESVNLRDEWSDCAIIAHMIAKPDLIEGMAKGMAVLESFDTERQRLNATLAAQRAGITRAAARRHLLTLAHLGYLETDGAYFWLSAKVLRFSGSYLASARLPRLLQPTLNRLASLTQASFSAVVLDGAEVVIVARSGSEWRATPQSPLRVLAHGLHLGARLPAHATSTGRMLLATLTPEALDAWFDGRRFVRLTRFTETDPLHLRALIDSARTQDWCIAQEEHELGVHALAVPLRDARGGAVAAINVVMSTPVGEAAAPQRELLPLLQDAAQELRQWL
jgi:IclR family transcriptional regulator, pca regulon regulatory protein